MQTKTICIFTTQFTAHNCLGQVLYLFPLCTEAYYGLVLQGGDKGEREDHLNTTQLDTKEKLKFF